MPNIKPFRDVDEHDVLNFFKYSGTLPVSKGTLVKIVSGVVSDQQLSLDAANGAAFANTANPRWSVKPFVTLCQSGDAPLGMLLYDVREVDENGEILLFNPRKQAEMQCVLSGQAVPVVTKGVFMFSGISGTVTAGASLYASYAGELTANGGTAVAPVVGKTLGNKDGNGWTLVKLDF